MEQKLDVPVNTWNHRYCSTFCPTWWQILPPDASQSNSWPLQDNFLVVIDQHQLLYWWLWFSLCSYSRHFLLKLAAELIATNKIQLCVYNDEVSWIWVWLELVLTRPNEEKRIQEKIHSSAATKFQQNSNKILLNCFSKHRWKAAE